MTSQIPKISGDCRKIKLQNFRILRYYSSICATHTCLRCDKVFKTAFYSLAVKALPIVFKSRLLGGHSVGGMKSGVSCFSRSTVSRA